MSQVIQTNDLKLSENQLFEIITLINNEWTKYDRTLEERVSQIISAANENMNNICIRFVVWSGNKCVAHASIFTREIYSPDKSFNIRGLGDVCVDPSQRGKGLGKLVVKSLFTLVQQNKWEPVLFQTAIPEFYEKLGCRKIYNRFYNSKNLSDPEVNPFWDDNIMIYPSSYDFPSGDIDLNGIGF